MIPAAMIKSIEFQKSELSQKLYEVFQEKDTGYWQFQFTAEARIENQALWSLALVEGKIIFSGYKKLSWNSFLPVLLRYISHLRTSGAKQALHSLIQESLPGERESVTTMLMKMIRNSLVSHQDAVTALQLQVLSDLDSYLFDSQGKAYFLKDDQLVSQSPVTGFELDRLLSNASQRRQQWQSLREQIPSMDAIPILNLQNFKHANLTPELRQKLWHLTLSRKTLTKIAYDTAKDPLEIAKFFAKLISQGLISLELSAGSDPKSLAPRIFVVDDSPLLLHEFSQLLTKWGYWVNCCMNPETAVQQILQLKPDMVFLDINMPGLSGFDLIKQIRQQPSLATTPLVLLTAENSLANQWRAKWGRCEFQAKPKTPQEVARFKTKLQELLAEASLIETKVLT